MSSTPTKTSDVVIDEVESTVSVPKTPTTSPKKKSARSPWKLLSRNLKKPAFAVDFETTEEVVLSSYLRVSSASAAPEKETALKKFSPFKLLKSSAVVKFFVLRESTLEQYSNKTQANSENARPERFWKLSELGDFENTVDTFTLGFIKKAPEETATAPVEDEVALDDANDDAVEKVEAPKPELEFVKFSADSNPELAKDWFHALGHEAPNSEAEADASVEQTSAEQALEDAAGAKVDEENSVVDWPVAEEAVVLNAAFPTAEKADDEKCGGWFNLFAICYAAE